MKYLSVCSGIEAATQAWHPLGWTPVAFSEIEAFPSAVLAHHYPHVPNWGDMTKFKEWPDADVDVLVGGTPCQSFSVAGLRKGLADPRGNLMLTYLAIADRYRPRWLLWENVPGVLSSSGGRDFGAFLGGLGQLGYGFAYRVLDAQYVRTCGKPYAVPQRRRRVFVVGYLGDWRRAAAVLIDREGLRGDSPPRRKAGQAVTHDVAPSLVSSGRGVERAGDTRGQDAVVGICANSGDVGYCLTASAQQSLDAETETLVAVAHSLRGEGHDASEDGTGRGVPLIPVGVTIHGTDKTASVASYTDIAGALRARTPGSQENSSTTVVQSPFAFAQNTRDEVRLFGGDGASVGALAAEPGMKQQAYVAQPFTIMERGRDGGQSLESRQDGTSNAILTPNGGRGGMGVGAIATAWTVRRLTPVECERLQAFPDQFTRIPYRGKPAEQCPDGPRYKALGNSMAVNVMQLIGERIAIVEKLQ